MTPSAVDMLLYTGSVYGLAWLITKARVTARLRRGLSRIPFLGDMLQCIVCTGTWVALGVLAGISWCTVFSSGFRPASGVDVVLLVGWSVAANWIIAHHTGDAE